MRMYTVLSIIFLNTVFIVCAMEQEIRWEDYFLSESPLNQSELEFGDLQEPALKRSRTEYEQAQETNNVEEQSPTNELFNYAPFRCTHQNCRDSFTVGSYLILHHKAVHKNTVYECDNCFKHFNTAISTWNECLTSLKNNVERKNEPPKFEKKHPLTMQSMQLQFSCLPALQQPPEIKYRDMFIAANLLYLRNIPVQNILARQKDNELENCKIVCDFTYCNHRAHLGDMPKHLLAVHLMKGYYKCPHDNCKKFYVKVNDVEKHHALEHRGCQLCEPMINNNIDAWRVMRDAIGTFLIQKVDHRQIEIEPKFVAKLTLWRPLKNVLESPEIQS